MSSKLILPLNYKDPFDVFDTQKAIKLVKDAFQDELAKNLDLSRVSAPLFVLQSTGLNDNLNGVERPVGFDILNLDNSYAEVVHSLAKWKRLALKKYDFWLNKGLYTDMNAVRRDEEFDNLHSIYVDQWDWEKVISNEQRNFDYLKETVVKIVRALKATEYQLVGKYHQLTPHICDQVHFITSQELLDLYPNLSPKERENEICRKYKTVFILQIGGKLSNGLPHDLRAPDYDDWQLNGDLFIWYDVLGCAVELSSMGIRVNAESLVSQLKERNCEDRLELEFHKMLVNNQLPLTIGGGIGQSRCCMVLLQKAHIGEVQVSIWPQSMIDECLEKGIHIL